MQPAKRTLLWLAASAALLLVAPASSSRTASACTPSTAASCQLTFRTQNGHGNNLGHPTWGQVGEQYVRVAPSNYVGSSAMVAGPSARKISNAIFNDLGQNLFSENNISQWGWAWGQFLDHDLGLRNETPAEPYAIPDPADPLERFTNDFGALGFNRTPAATGTGKTDKRQQTNTLSATIDASQVYGSTDARLVWLTQTGTPDLLLPGGYLPKATARGDVKTAPPMDLMGALTGRPDAAIVSGDVRANENIALTAITTLFARESNRIANLLPASLPAATRLQIARKVVGAEMQYITYTQFLPTLGVKLPAYSGYNPTVNPGIQNEFASVGFRAHSMVHGEFEPIVPAGTYSAAQLADFAAHGITAETLADGTIQLVIPLAVAFGNPDLLQAVGLGPILSSLSEREYKNDEQIDETLRSILFGIPKKGTDPAACEEPAANPGCFNAISDLGADDVMRGRDHGMPNYNQMRIAYGLPPATSFRDITGEGSEELPAGMQCGDPATLAIVSLSDGSGNPVEPGDADNAVNEVRGSTLAARLKCLYGDVGKVDAFVGMVSEPHLAGTEFGQLQYAIWLKQFKATRDGDRFFYLNDPGLATIKMVYGIDYRVTLAQVIQANTGVVVPGNAFKASRG